jgi:hypothetical protein
VKVTVAPPDRNRAGDKQAQCRRVLVLGAHFEDGFENVVEVLGKLAVEALAGGFGQADDIAFRSAIRVAAAPLGCTLYFSWAKPHSGAHERRRECPPSAGLLPRPSSSRASSQPCATARRAGLTRSIDPQIIDAEEASPHG